MSVLQHNARINRMPSNPLDKCTIVSVYPLEVVQVNHTIFPGVFQIPAAADGKFEILVVGPSSWFKEMEEGQPYLEIPTNSIRMAQSVIEDYCNGLLGCDGSTMGPGLFFIPGEYNKGSILKYVNPTTGETFAQLLENAKTKQKNFFAERIKIADILWARTSGNPLAVDNIARLAAEKLGVASHKSWMQDFTAIEKQNCPACGNLINPNFPVCPNCKTVINVEKAKELGLKFAS